MLTDTEKNALFHFSSVMSDKLLKGLAGSVTNGRISCKTREDAVNCLLLHSESLFSILNHRKVSSSVLLNYLHQLKVDVPGTASREVLMERILDKWKLLYTPSNNNLMALPNNENWSGMPHTNFQISSIPYTNVTNNSIKCGTSNMDLNQPSQTNFNNSGSMPALHHSGHDMTDQLMITATSMQPSNATQPVTAPNSNNSSHSQTIASYQLLKEVNMLAFDEFMVNFAKMFYELFNSNSAGGLMHDLNRSHFFEECRMAIMIKGDEEDIENIREGVVNVLNMLSDLKREHPLIFNPNLTPEGVRGKTDSHGLIYAVANGTLHRGRNQFVGAFEQSFILRKDPFEQNSCKIAESTLILRSIHGVDSISQLLLPSSKRSERNLAIGSAPSQSSALQIMYHNN